MEYVVVKGFMVLLFVLIISVDVDVDAATCGGDISTPPADYAGILSAVLSAAMFDAESKPVGVTSDLASAGGVESTAVCYHQDATGNDCATCLQTGLNDLLGNCSGNEHGEYTTDVCSIKFGPETPDNN